MNSTKNRIDKKFKIVLSVGDESGIGPEIILKALNSNEIPKDIDILIVGSKKILQDTFKSLKSLGVENIVDPDTYEIHDLNIPFASSNPKIRFGNASFHYLKEAIEIVKNNPSSALVTGPIC